MSVDRRGFLVGVAATLGAVVQDSLAGSGPAGKLADPRSAGPGLNPTTAADNDARLQAIEKQLKCHCGCGLDIYTCRTTDFDCPVNAGLHGQIVALDEAGNTAQQILDAFVAQYGPQVLMAPPRRGFNLVGYLLPSVAVLVAAAFLIRTLRRWTRVAAAAPAPSAHPSVDASPAELERLRRELERLPS